MQIFKRIPFLKPRTIQKKKKNLSAAGWVLPVTSYVSLPGTTQEFSCVFLYCSMLEKEDSLENMHKNMSCLSNEKAFYITFLWPLDLFRNNQNICCVTCRAWLFSGPAGQCKSRRNTCGIQNPVLTLYIQQTG